MMVLSAKNGYRDRLRHLARLAERPARIVGHVDRFLCVAMHELCLDESYVARLGARGSAA
jgi:hypothetical protein